LDNAEDTIIKTREEEWNRFLFTILQHIATTMKLRLPSLYKIDEMVNHDMYEWDAYDIIPSSLGIDLSLPLEPNVRDGKRIPPFPKASTEDLADQDNLGLAVTDTEEQEVELVKTLIERNHIIIDMPLNDNLNRYHVVQRYMNFALETTDNILSEHVINDEELQLHGGERPVLELMTPFNGDGAPVAACSRIMETAAKKNRAETFHGLVAFCGGFHWTIEIPKIRADLSYDILKFVVSSYRDTESKLKKVFAPRDPRQAADEAPFYLAAFYCAAADSCAETKGELMASPAEVHTHMLDRAKEYTLAMAFLQYLWFMELFVLFRDIEKTSSADLLFTALRIVLPFLMVLNAKNYIRMTMDQLVWWETTSEAEKILFEQFILTRRTADGKPVFMDRLQEMFNTVFRSKLGKVSLPGQRSNMMRVAMSLGDIQKQRKNLASFRKKNDAPNNLANNGVSERHVRLHRCIVVFTQQFEG
jgi:hypothetical protein